MKKKNHHPLHHLQTLVNHKPKNMTAVAAIAAHAAIAKNSDNNPRMKNSVAAALYLWVFGLLDFSLYLSQST